MDRHETDLSGSGAQPRPGDGRQVVTLLLHCLGLSAVGAILWMAALVA